MLERAKRTWRELKGSPEGHRFEMHYRRERERRGGSSPLRRAISLVAAIAAIAIGVVLVFIPGPAIFFCHCGSPFGNAVAGGGAGARLDGARRSRRVAGAPPLVR